MNSYPQEDFPWTLYFQGEPMPKWTNCWHWQGVADSRVDWYVEEVRGRLDHVGTIESERSDIFLIAAQQHLAEYLDHRNAFSAYPELPPEETSQVYSNIVEGIQKMISIAERTEVVFWTSGYEADLIRLKACMERHAKGYGNPDYFVPPHEERRRRDRRMEINFQRQALRRRLDTLVLDKSMKTYLHNLKDLKI